MHRRRARVRLLLVGENKTYIDGEKMSRKRLESPFRLYMTRARTNKGRCVRRPFVLHRFVSFSSAIASVVWIVRLDRVNCARDLPRRGTEIHYEY